MIVFKRGMRYVRRTKLAKPKSEDVLSKIKHLHDLENDASSTYVEKSASAIQAYLGLLDSETNDPQFWRSVKLFESAAPTAQQVAPLLPQLWAAAERSPKASQPENMRTVGDLAYSVNMLGDGWTEKYMDALSYKNPYRAIELWSKDREKYGIAAGIHYYCRAGLPKKAESLASHVDLSSPLWRELVLAYCKQHNAAKTDEWLGRRKNMSERDQKWAWHVLRLYNMDNAASRSLPKPTWPVPAPSQPKFGQRDHNLIGEVSKLVAVHPQILEDDELYKAWARFVVEPQSFERLVPVLDAVIHQDPFADLGTALKCISKEHITEFVLKMDRDEAYPTPGLWEWAQAVQNAATPDQAAVICEKMRLYNYLFTTQGFSAACNSRVPNLVRLADEARQHLELTEHMLICIWRATTAEPPEWLWKQSAQQKPSFRLLKNIVAKCLDNKNIVGVARALYDFMVVNNAAVDEVFVDWMVKYAEGSAKETKFSPPRDESGGPQAWRDVCQLLCQKTDTHADWVCSKIDM